MKQCPYYTLEGCTHVDDNGEVYEGIEYCPSEYMDVCMFAILTNDYEDDWCIPEGD